MAVPEIVPPHSMFGFEVADHRLDGRAAAELALDKVNTLNLESGGALWPR